MSARTSEPTTPQRTRTSARFAAASLLALSMMLPMCSTASAAEVQQLIADAQVQTETIGNDLDRVHAQLPALHPVLRNDVLDAVESVEAATDEARSALERATDDDEAAGLWKKIAGFGDDKIIRIGTSDNFWQMGDTGPCGPCSEIFIDQGPTLQGGPPGSPDEDGDRFLEFWNLVFMQYEQLRPGERNPLPRPSIDTGMGLGRIAAILQGVHSNYDTDLFRAMIDAVVAE